MNRKHLDDTELARLAVEPEAPPGQEPAGHLRSCPRCQDAVETLRADLHSLSTLARASAPAPSRPVSLPQRAHGLRTGRTSGFPRLAWGACGGALAATAVLLLMFWFFGAQRPLELTQAEARQLLLEDAALLREMRALERDPLPGIVTALTADHGEELDDPYLAFELLEPLFLPGDPFS
jgi:anti-sigma factor RsiW